MKLEALNGNLMSSLTAKIASQELLDEKSAGGGGVSQPTPVLDTTAAGAAAASDETAAVAELPLIALASSAAEISPEAEFHDEEAETDGVCGAEKEASGKKKGTRKKRSLNWEEAERGLLLEVIKPKVDYVENRSVDAKSIKAKRLAWMQITKQFNALNFRHRSLEQIQVQWRSMKNSGKREHQQKHPKSATLEGMELIEFMEELQKDPISARSQTRGGGVVVKKEPIDMDDEEDTPLAALPTLTNASDDAAAASCSLQTSSALALPSPPLPPAELAATIEAPPPPQATPTRSRKKPGPQPAAQKKEQQTQAAVNTGCSKPKRQRSQNTTQSEVVASTAVAVAAAAAAVSDVPQQPIQLPVALAPLTTTSTAAFSSSPVAAVAGAAAASNDEKYKKQLFELMKRARLAEMDYARREHEQKLRFEQTEQELKLRQLHDAHEIRMRHYQAEHEARMRAYSLNSTPATLMRNNAKSEITNDAGGNVFK